MLYNTINNLSDHNQRKLRRRAEEALRKDQSTRVAVCSQLVESGKISIDDLLLEEGVSYS